MQAENHRASDDERLASLRQLGIATNSLAVLDDYLSNSSENWYSSQAFPPPYSLLGRDEGPPSDEELAPLGGEATGFELITQVYEPADEVRRMEVAFALAKNLRNTRIRKVHVLAENGRDGRRVDGRGARRRDARPRADPGAAAAVLGRGGLRGGVAAAPGRHPQQRRLF